jgi:hypothetical protein
MGGGNAADAFGMAEPRGVLSRSALDHLAKPHAALHVEDRVNGKFRASGSKGMKSAAGFKLGECIERPLRGPAGRLMSSMTRNGALEEGHRDRQDSAGMRSRL